MRAVVYAADVQNLGHFFCLCTLSLFPTPVCNFLDNVCFCFAPAVYAAGGVFILVSMTLFFHFIAFVSGGGKR